MKKQPVPNKNNKNPDINDIVIKEFRLRKKMGIKKYGVALKANNGRDALEDLKEELMDAVLYVTQMIEEFKIQEKNK